MIDMHLHVVDPQLPGVKGGMELLDTTPAAVAERLGTEMRAAGIEIALGMGCLSDDPEDPLGIAGTLAVAEHLPGLHPIGVADPRRADAAHLRRVEEELRRGRVKALKGYLGYLHHGPEYPGYLPYYRLAATYGLPVIFHTGDTWSPAAKVKYAHPLRVDEVAVDHPDVRFVLAHVGNPWLIDAAEVIFKNDNVWADLSGLLVGDATYFQQLEQEGHLAKVLERLRLALDYTEKPERFLYGSDWPLVPLLVYRNFIRQLIPVEQRPAVFRDNARALFRL